MLPDGSLNLDAVAAQAAWLAHSGVVGVFLGGTTGEWCSLTTDERLSLQAAWGRTESPLVKIAHLGHNCQRDSMALARHAAEAGMDATAAVGPSFLRPGTAEELAAYFSPIAEQAGDIPFYIYHIPGLSGLAIDPEEQIEACLKMIPNFAGLKFTDPDVFAFARCMKRFESDCELMWGVDERLLSALPYGVKAAVGSTYNYAAPLFNAMLSAFAQGDHAEARRQSDRAVGLVELLLEFGVLAAGKSLMACRGVDCGPVRPPARAISEAKKQAFYQRIAEAGYLDAVPEAVTTDHDAKKAAGTL